MSTQLDAFAHRRLAQSSKTLVALLVYPPSSVGFVLKQLRNCLFDFRGVRNIHSHIVCVSVSEAECKNAKKERDVKVLLLSEEILTPASVQSVKPLYEMQEEFNDDTKTVENVTFVSLEELLANVNNEKKGNLTDNIYFSSVLRDRLCHGLTGVNNNSSKSNSKHNVEKNTKYMNTEFALKTFTVHLTYVNYTMPELLKMVIEHYQFECSRNSLSSTNNSNDTHSVACNDEETNHTNTNTIKGNIAILSGFEQVGHIAHVNLASSHLPFALCIGQVILDCNPNIHVVVNKVETIATTFREFKMDVIALRFGAIQCLLHEYVHSHAKYGTNVEFVNLHTQIDQVKQYLRQEQFCLTGYSTLECNDATKEKEEEHHNTKKSEKSVNCSSCKENNKKEVIYEHNDNNNNNDETFQIKEFMHTCLSDALIDALLTSTVKQEGCFFTVPYNKVYWNSRLSHEHSLLVSEMSSHDVLFDVMAGVGPFAIPAALRGLTVFANDLNPFAAAYMEFNRAANHLHSSAMHVYNMDGREFMRTVLLTEFVKDLKEYYLTMMLKQNEKQHKSSRPSRQFHVVMNLPALAVTFLDVFEPLSEEEEEEWGANALRTLLREEFCKLHTTKSNNNIMEEKVKHNAENLEKNNDQNINKKPHNSTCDVKEQLMQELQHKCIIHVYCFSSAEDVCADALRQVEQNIGYSLHTNESGEMCKARLVRDVSPLKRMICVSFSLPRAFWQRYFL